MRLTLNQATGLIDAALVEARKRGLAPLSLAVLDAGGHLIAFKREDGAGILRFDLAFAKAWGALGMGYGTREITERVGKSPAFVTSLYALSGGRIVPSPGGVLVLSSEKEVLGAVGVSGDTGDNDEACAIAGIAAVNLFAAPGLIEP